METPTIDLKKVRLLNDDLRICGSGGSIKMTSSVLALPDEEYDEVLTKVRTYNFTKDIISNPDCENNFGSFLVAGQPYYFKIDCYNKAETIESPDRSDPEVTHRVMTIMTAIEY